MADPVNIPEPVERRAKRGRSEQRCGPVTDIRFKAEGVRSVQAIRTESRKPSTANPPWEAIKHRKHTPRKTAKGITAGQPVPKTDTGGPVENTKAYGDHSWELNKIAP